MATESTIRDQTIQIDKTKTNVRTYNFTNYHEKHIIKALTIVSTSLKTSYIYIYISNQTHMTRITTTTHHNTQTPIKKINALKKEEIHKRNTKHE